MKQTTIVLVACASSLLGIYLGRNIDVSFLPVLIGALSYLVMQDKRIRILLLASTIAFWVGNARAVQQQNGFEVLRAKFETKTIVVGESLDDAEYDSRGQLAFTMSNIEIDGVEIPGQIAVSGFGEFSVLRGDIVEVSGKLFEARGANQARISFAKLDVQKKDVSSLNKLRRQFIKKLRDNLPEPLSSFAGGLLIGQRSTIPDQIIDDLRVSGLAHIIAVSGYNLTILVRAIMSLLKKASRYQRLIVSISMVVAFLLVTGFSASIVRAAIVCILSLLAWYYGRVFRPAVLLLLTASLTGLYKPEYVWGDVGWYLSFLAFTGVMIVGPVVRGRLFGDREVKFLTATIVDTLAVLLMVSPYSLYIFGTLSLVALPANVVVAPTIPLTMALSLFAAVVPYQLALLVYPARLFLDGLLGVAQVFAMLPSASIQVKITLIDTVVMYTIITIVIFMMWAKRKQRLKSLFLLQ